MQKIKLMNIVVDPNIQVREVEPFTVSTYADSMRAGAEFPPLILEKGSNRIVCGNHRFTAYKRVFEPEYAVGVIFKTYKNDAEIIRESARDNSRHGRPLETWDKKRIAVRLKALGDRPEDIAKLLSIQVSKIEEWAGMTVFVIGSGGRSGKPVEMPLKHGMEHLSGANVTAEQYEAHKRRDCGIPTKKLVDMITRHIESGWINTEDEGTMESLRALKVALGGVAGLLGCRDLCEAPGFKIKT